MSQGITRHNDPAPPLEAQVRAQLRALELPCNERSLYPTLHAVAYALEHTDRSEAVGAVLQAVCDAVGAIYGSQYMSNVLLARFRDGTMSRALREF